MHHRFWLCLPLVMGLPYVIPALCSEPANDAANKPSRVPLKAADKADDDGRVSVATARDRAALIHKLYAATLDSMHEHYFHANRSVLPARALEDVFAEMAEQENIET